MPNRPPSPGENADAGSDTGWRCLNDPRIPAWRPGDAGRGPGTKGGPGPHEPLFARGRLYQGREQYGLIPYAATMAGQLITRWQEMPIPAIAMCSPWNRIFAEPPDSDIHQSLIRALPTGTQWRAWPLHAVMQGWLAHAEVVLTPTDLASLCRGQASPDLSGLRELITRCRFPLELVQGPTTLSTFGPAVTVRLSRRERLSALWNLPALADAYRQVLPEPMADHQASGLDFYRKHPVAHFAHHPEELAMVEWAVLGLITGDTPGHVALEIATTTTAIDRLALQHAVVF